jgi:hypothetical protein
MASRRQASIFQNRLDPYPEVDLRQFRFILGAATMGVATPGVDYQ